MQIQNGTFNIFGGLTNSYWPWGGSGSLTMSGGILDFKNVGVTLYSDSFTENITGGTIRTAGNLYNNSGVTFFTPEGGTFEFTGSNNSVISLQPECYFHDLKINITSGAMVSLLSDVTVKHAIDVAGGTLHLVYYEINLGEGAVAK
jgi:hypothetical protein